MPGLRICILALLVAVAQPGRSIAGGTASISRQIQVFCGSGEATAEKRGPLLTPGDLFTANSLPEITCFDSPPKSRICVEWISIADILDDSTGENNMGVLMDTGEFEGLGDVCFALPAPGRSSLFLLVAPYSLGIGYCKTPLPEGTGRRMTAALLCL
jgi:hypothetical protein